MDLRLESDPAPLLAHVEEDAVALALDLLHGGLELATTVAAPRTENITGEAFAVDADERRFGGIDLPLHEGEVDLVVQRGLVHVEIEFPVVGGHLDHLDAFD